MATITIRNVDDAVYERLKREARENHRSLEAEARARLDRPSGRSTASLVAEGRNFAERMRARHGEAREDSVAAIRALRDQE